MDAKNINVIRYTQIHNQIKGDVSTFKHRQKIIHFTI